MKNGLVIVNTKAVYSVQAASTKGQEANVVTDYTLKMLGLDICADTMVGDQMIRGFSGGQRKRVTTGEMIVGQSKVLLMDEISAGLDSSTTFQIVKSLKQFINILEGTTVICRIDGNTMPEAPIQDSSPMSMDFSSYTTNITLAELWLLLEQEKAEIETNMAHIEQQDEQESHTFYAFEQNNKSSLFQV
ncbi:ABC transporter G family member 37 [Artemisia annua]|uniref:ABC transporter G family member 37 n=1 Tax=Artemisia annua TaxID=35608 RepID=A0A2U1KG55_ARTAN|nr:ABC transporter G family member 37 [Artemisia annua]